MRLVGWENLGTLCPRLTFRVSRRGLQQDRTSALPVQRRRPPQPYAVLHGYPCPRQVAIAAIYLLFLTVHKCYDLILIC